ncbi:MAG: polysaccharide deacetylase family protein [Clostridia bacterium]|nr:polysaccharide deacetylase family protein [Clostridia bacterium]
MKIPKKVLSAFLAFAFVVTSSLVVSVGSVSAAAGPEVIVTKPQMDEAFPKGKPMAVEAIVKNCTNVASVDFYEIAGKLGGYGKWIGQDSTYPYNISYTPTDYSAAQGTRISKNHIVARLNITDGSSVSSAYIRFYVYPESEFIATVCRWKDNKKAAYTPTYDDSYLIQHQRDINALHKTHGIKGTIFWDTAAAWDYTSLNAILADNMLDIGSHTVSHPDLTTITSAADLTAQLVNSQSTLYTQTNRKPYTLAYPYYGTNPTVASETMKHYIAARWGSNNGNLIDGSIAVPGDPGVGINDAYTAEYMYIKAMCPEKFTPATVFNGWLDQAITDGGWLVTSMHGLADLNPDSWKAQWKSDLNTHYAYAKTKVDNNTVWTDTFENVSFYLRERNAAVINYVTSTVPNQYKFNIDIVDYFLTAQQKALMTRDITMKVSVPTDWTSVSVSQGTGTTRIVNTVTENGLKFAYFNAKPQAGDVVVAKYN